MRLYHNFFLLARPLVYYNGSNDPSLALQFKWSDNTFNANPDPPFHLNANPDPIFHFNAVPDPAPHQSEPLCDWSTAVLRIRDVYPGSRILISTHPGSRILILPIPDLGFRIPDPKTATKERGERKLLSYLFM